MGFALKIPAVVPEQLLALADAHLRADGLHAALIEGYVQGAIAEFERITERAMFASTWYLYLDTWPRGYHLDLGRGKCAGVTAIEYLPTGNAPDEWETMAPASYLVDAVRQPGRIVLADGANWPAEALVPINGVRVEFSAGWTWAELPGDVRNGLLLKTQELFDGLPAQAGNAELYIRRIRQVWQDLIRRYK
jgi:uncharacterized phiE125 gp8 family phage protein